MQFRARRGGFFAFLEGDRDVTQAAVMDGGAVIGAPATTNAKLVVRAPNAVYVEDAGALRKISTPAIPQY